MADKNKENKDIVDDDMEETEVGRIVILKATIATF